MAVDAHAIVPAGPSETSARTSDPNGPAGQGNSTTTHLQRRRMIISPPSHPSLRSVEKNKKHRDRDKTLEGEEAPADRKTTCTGRGGALAFQQSLITSA